MELILVRHAQPAWTAPDGTGRNDPGLTELGHAQATMVADRLGDGEQLPGRGDVDRLFASPAIRAQETAAPIAATLGLEVETLPWLLELRNPPEWEGAPIEVVQAAFDRIQGLDRAGWWGGHKGGESLRDFHERVTGGLRGFLASLGITPAPAAGLWDVSPPADEPGLDRVVAVAHGGTNSVIIAHLLNVAPEPWEWERFTMGHASVAVLMTTAVAGHHIWSLRVLGDAHHLAVDDRTL